MESKDIAPFVRSLSNVFSTMLQIHITAENPRFKDPANPCFDVSAIIGLSEDVTGAVVLSFPSETATRIVELFTGCKIEVDDPDFADAVGELVNMVAGGAKVEFENRRVSISCPSVIVGANHRVFQQKNSPIIEIPCECECGAFSLLVSMKTVGAESPASGADLEAVQ